MKDKIVIKKIISLTLAFSFLIMSVTGIILYIVPKGKVAYWANWQIFGLTKTQYGDIHITSMFLFLVVTIWHIYYNWKPLVNYLRDSTQKVTLFKKELLIAFVLNIIFVVGTLVGVQPFQFALDIKEDIKTYWEKQYGSPPYGHAEESSLKSFSKRMGIDVKEAMKLLSENSIKVSTQSQTLLQISQENAVSSKVIYDIIKPKRSAADEKITFMGRRTLGELSKMNKINLEKSLLYLENRGYKATPESRMREIANTLDETPYEIFDKLKMVQ